MNAIESARKALKTYRLDGTDYHMTDAYHASKLAQALSALLDTVQCARESEETTHRILTDGRKPTREDSSRTWRILNGDQ